MPMTSWRSCLFSKDFFPFFKHLFYLWYEFISKTYPHKLIVLCRGWSVYTTIFYTSNFWFNNQTRLHVKFDSGRLSGFVFPGNGTRNALLAVLNSLLTTNIYIKSIQMNTKLRNRAHN